MTVSLTCNCSIKLDFIQVRRKYFFISILIRAISLIHHKDTFWCFFSNPHYLYFQGNVSKLCILFKFIRPIISALTILTDPLEPPHTHAHTTTTTTTNTNTTTNNNIYSGNFQLSDPKATRPTSFMLTSCKPCPYNADTDWMFVLRPIHTLKPNAQCGVRGFQEVIRS